MVDFKIAIEKDNIDLMVASIPIIGILVTLYIAWLQHKLGVAQHEISVRNTEIDERNLKFLLYKDRKTIYDNIKEAFQDQFANGTISENAFSKYKRETRDVEFLLDQKIQTEIDEILKKFAEQMALKTEMFHDNGMPVEMESERRRELAERNHDISLWLLEKWNQLPKTFAKYLKID